jgi:hypothetical protein
LKNNNYDIILLENVSCINKDELKARERFYIETLECVNKVIPGRTNQEYAADHKEQRKEYYEKHKAIKKDFF